MRVCEVCSRDISDRHGNAVTCSADCARERQRAIQRAFEAAKYVPVVHPPRTCEGVCGGEFSPKRSDQRYCSRLCQAETRALRQKRERAARESRPCIKCGAPCPIQPGHAVCIGCRADPRGPRPLAEHRRRLRRYGVTDEWLVETLAAQGECCAICGTTNPGGNIARVQDWSIDHDHATGRARGLLCARCNLGIGQLRDDPQILRLAADYIDSHRQQLRLA